MASDDVSVDPDEFVDDFHVSLWYLSEFNQLSPLLVRGA
jgi:hypothetical protein